MSLPASGGPRPPLRVLGVGLVAVAVGLIGVGVVTAGSGSSETAAAAPSTTLPPAPPATSPLPTTPTMNSTTTLPPQPAPSAASTSVAVQPQPPATEREATPTRLPVRVFNNSTIIGLGEKAAREIRADGWQVVEVGNFQGLFPTTTVYYHPGAGEQQAAQSLALSIGATAAPRIDEIASYAPGLILVVTSDFAG